MKKVLFLLLTITTIVSAGWFSSKPSKDHSKEGASPERAKQHLDVKLDSRGLTLEQGNIVDSYNIENKPGAVKHMYIISQFTGKVIFYSTVKGKVTDNAKGLTPSRSIGRYGDGGYKTSGFYFNYKGNKGITTEVPNPSGTYGTSSPYIYWKDVKGQYFKRFMSSTSEVIISDKPIVIRDGSLVLQFK